MPPAASEAKARFRTNVKALGEEPATGIRVIGVVANGG
jgi:hypothetical protein